MERTSAVRQLVFAACAVMLAPAGMNAQGRGGAPAQPTTPQAAAPIDVTGYWVSQIVDEWRFRVTPQKGDIPYLPINADARRVANAWDPDKDIAEGKQCRAYGAVGVMQRPGRLHVTWENDRTLRIDADAGTQTRLLHFGAAPAQKGARNWQGYSTAQWVVAGRPLLDTGGTGFVPGLGARGPNRGGTLIAKTDNMLSGYIRKNGVPYSEEAVLTEYFNLVTNAAPGAQNQPYLVVTAFVEDPKFLTGPFIRTYTFKKQSDASGWDPTPCLPK
jgi:hypothetical protein